MGKEWKNVLAFGGSDTFLLHTRNGKRNGGREETVGPRKGVISIFSRNVTAVCNGTRGLRGPHGVTPGRELSPSRP